MATITQYLRFQFYDSAGALVTWNGTETDMYFTSNEVRDVQVPEDVESEAVRTSGGYAVQINRLIAREMRFSIRYHEDITAHKFDQIAAFMRAGHQPAVRIMRGATNYNTSTGGPDAGFITFARAAIELPQWFYRTIGNGQGQQIAFKPSDNEASVEFIVREAVELSQPTGGSTTTTILAGGVTITTGSSGTLVIPTTFK